MDLDYLLDPNHLILKESAAESTEMEIEKVYLKFRSQISYIQRINDRELGNNFSFQGIVKKKIIFAVQV